MSKCNCGSNNSTHYSGCAITEPQAESESGPYTWKPIDPDTHAVTDTRTGKRVYEHEYRLTTHGNAGAWCEGANFEATSRDARVKALTDALKWTLDWIADGTDASEGETPAHDCEFSSNPEKGACDFHEKYFESVAALSDGEKTGWNEK